MIGSHGCGHHLIVDRRKIYLQPLGEFPRRSPSPERLRECAMIYFALDTETLPVVQGQNFTTRVNPLTHNHQILTTDLLRFLKTKLPPNAFCVSGNHDGGFVSGASLELRIRASLAAAARRRVQLRAIRCGLL